jgi:ketosteroid isomerase-like protein
MTEASAGSMVAAAREWCEAWNRRDLDAVMAHYAEDVEFSSPTVVQRWGLPDGWLRGKDKLRANFEIGMQKPGLRFELVDVLVGASGCYCVVYRRETGALVTDLVETDASGLGCRVVACYGAPAFGH